MELVTFGWLLHQLNSGKLNKKRHDYSEYACKHVVFYLSVQKKVSLGKEKIPYQQLIAHEIRNHRHLKPPKDGYFHFFAQKYLRYTDLQTIR